MNTHTQDEPQILKAELKLLVRNGSMREQSAPCIKILVIQKASKARHTQGSKDKNIQTKKKTNAISPFKR